MEKIAKKNIEDIFALTPMQEGMLYHHLKNSKSDHYFEQLTLNICGEIDVSLFKSAWNKVVEDNDMLRTLFRWENLEHPVQVVLKEHNFEPLFYDFSNETGIEKKKKLEEVKVKDKQEKFDLREVAFRVTLCKIKADEYEMIISNHHILYDGWSNGIILKEFFETYDELSRGEQTNLPVKDDKMKFKKFVKWISSQDNQKQKKFWEEYLKDFTAGAGGTRKIEKLKKKELKSPGNYHGRLSGKLKDKLFDFVKAHNLTLASLFYGSWGILLQKLHSKCEVLFDITVSGRPKEIKEVENIVGLFINTLPLRVLSKENESVLGLLSRIHGNLQKWEEFENSSQVIIKEYLEKCYWGAFFDSVVILENYPLEKQLLRTNRKLTVNSYTMSGMTNYDITLMINIFDDINLIFTYNKEVFNEESAVALFRCFEAFIEEMADNPFEDISVIDVPFKLREEKDKILHYLGRDPMSGLGASLSGIDQEYMAPGNEVEEKIASVWSKVLDIDREKISIDADFFDFGGHSLKASLLAALLHQELQVKFPLSEIFHRPTIRELAQYVIEADKSKYICFEAAETKEYYALSSAQKRLYMLQQADLGSVAYNEYSFMIMEGKLDKGNLGAVFSKLIHRHESLRTAFIYDEGEGEPVQKPVQEVDFKVKYLEASDEESKGIITGFIRPFDLSKAPLIRVGLIKLTDEKEKYILLFDMHHIISDGSSVNIFIKEFMDLYQGNELPEQQYQYKDFSEWQNNRLNSGKFIREKKFWLDQFFGELPILNMPLDYPRPMIHSFEGERLTFYWEENLVQQLENLTRNTGTTLYMVLLAALGILLSKYSGQQDIIIGTPVAGRDHKDLLNVFGLLLEMIAIRIYPEEFKTFYAYLKEVKGITLASYENQSYPFGEWFKQLQLEDDLSRNPLFDVMLIVQNQGRLQLEIDNLKITPFEFENHISKVDINLEVFEIQEEKERRIRLELEYCTKLFKPETMERLISHLKSILVEVVKAPWSKLASIDMVTEKEKREILDLFSNTYTMDTAIDFGKANLLPGLFEAQVEKTPDRIAVIGIEPGARSRELNLDNVSVTYRKLNKRINQLAHLLRERGFQSDNIVGIMVERSIEMIIGILGVLKAGGAYLPIAPDYPGERINYMLADSKANILITTRDLAEEKMISCQIRDNSNLNWGLNDVNIMFTDSLSPNSLTPQPASPLNVQSPRPGDLVYIIYTSGSTGKPKGVLVEHHNVVANLFAFYNEFEITGNDTVIQLASCVFDAFVEEVYPVLLKGGKLAIPSMYQILDIHFLSDFIVKHDVNIIDCTPLLLKELNQLNRINCVDIFISGGDILKKEYAANFLTSGKVYNTYGPTEATVCAAYYRCNPDIKSNIPIGKPIANYRIYILDRYDNLQPIGLPGELCIGGSGVTRGYLNSPELTAERFDQDLWDYQDYHDKKDQKFLWGGPGGAVFSKSVPPGCRRQKIYKTGDLARWLPDGNIEFLGRMDRQVKVRGFRVELGEIEKRLLEHENIKEAVVLPNKQDEGDNHLCAYFAAAGEFPDSTPELMEYLSRYLPGYMIPSYFIPLPKMPLTASGKVDTKKLPAAVESLYNGTIVEYIGPRTETEKKLEKICKEILGLEKISMKDNFFQIGGDSIRMIRVIVRIREEMHREISLAAFFEHPTLESISKIIENEARQKSKLPSIKPVSRDRKIPLSFSQEQVWILQNLYKDYMSYHVPRGIRIKGNLNTSLLERTFTEIIKRHEIFRTVFPLCGEEPEQHILAPYECKIPVMDWRDLEVEEQSRRVSEFILEEGQRQFYLDQGPLLRLNLLRLRDKEHILVLCEHHLIHDGWSQGVLIQEFLVIFKAFSEGKPSPLPALPIQYADFACWQREYFQGERLKQYLDFWKKKLSGLAPLLELPTDRPRPPIMSGKGVEKIFYIPAELAHKLEKTANKYGATLFMTMMAAFKALLYRYTGVEDLCVGTGVANRQHKEMEGMLGMVINTIALRTRILGQLTFIETLKRVKETCLEAYQFEDTPFEKVVEAVQPQRSLSYTPIFQVMFSFMDTPGERMHIPGLELQAVESHNRSSKFDIIIIVVPPSDQQTEETRGQIELNWEYSIDIFDASSMERMFRHYTRLLEEIVLHTNKKISSLTMLEESERINILYDFNDTVVEFPHEKTIHQLFTDQVLKTPDHIALADSTPGVKPKKQADGQYVSYNVLNKKSNRLALFLISRGIKIECIVGIIAERSVEMVVGILGILKAGGAYLPISPGLPAARKKLMLRDSGAKQVLLQKHLIDDNDLKDWLLQTEILHLEYQDDDFHETSDGIMVGSPPVTVKPENPGYVIYTSGSTGKPKGVVLEHRSIVNYIYWAAGRYVKEEKITFPLYTSFSFDLTVTSIFTPLVTGNTIVVYQGDEKEFLIKKVIEENRVNFVKLTPSHLKLIREIMDGSSIFFQAGEKSNIKCFVVGGENLPAQLAGEIYEKFNHEIEIYNEYGPTETVVGSMIYQYDPAADKEGSVPIGLPIANTYIYLLDESKKPVPLGVAGELFISGAGVGRGYLNRPGLTAEKFLDNPFLPGERMYVTGDLARRLDSGCIEFLGRKDQQVKIRGYRVELEEIENKIKNFNKEQVQHTLPTVRPMEEIFKTHQGGVLRCSRCLLHTDYPGIEFDEQGVCSVCREYETYEEHVNRYFKDEESFVRLVEEIKQNPGRNKGDYDCLLMFSGGKDSSYVLYRLVDMGLKILTFTFDNGYISEAAFDNIKKITGELQVDHIVEKAEHMNEVFVESLRSNHNVCQGCWHALNTFAVKIAHEKRIPLVISGLSRGQIFDMRLEGLFRAGIFAEDEIEEKLLLFRKTFHSKDNRFSWILDTALDEEVVESIGFVDFFRYYSTPVHQVEEYLTAKGWKRPADTGFCSSNCLINDVGIYVYMQERGSHFYAAPLSWDIRMGQLSRDDGLVEMGFKSDAAQVEKILNEIGYYDSAAIKDAVVVDKEDDEGNRYLCAYIVSEKSGSFDIDQLRRFLARELPDYMIPSYFIQVDEIPLNIIGKVDRKALLEKPGTSLGMNVAYAAPRDEKEKAVAELCQEVFKIDKIGIKDNFFSLGATSFNIIQISGKLQEVFNKEIPVITLFEYPTIASFMEYMHGENREAVENSSCEDEEWLTSQKRGRNRAREIRKKRKEEEDNEKH